MSKMRIEARGKDTKMEIIFEFDGKQMINKWSKAGRIKLQYKIVQSLGP